MLPLGGGSPLIGGFPNISLKSEAWNDSTGCYPRRNVHALLGDVRRLEFLVNLLLVRKSLRGGIRTKKGRGQEMSVLMAKSASIGSCLGGSHMSGDLTIMSLLREASMIWGRGSVLLENV